MRLLPLALLFVGCASRASRSASTPANTLASEEIAATEVDGFVVVEAEQFARQTRDDKRAWYITSATKAPPPGPDIDPPHVEGASGGAYIEVLPDTGVDGTPPIPGESISDKPGEMAVLSYRIRFTTAGRYYIWVRAFGTDGDDNTLHFGLNDAWPDSSARQHTYASKNWRWANRHRQHKGKIYFDVPTAGVHTVNVSMREDGCELDQFVLTTGQDYLPPSGAAYPGQLRPAFVETDGLLVIEAESVPPAAGWTLATATPAFAGNGYVEWTQANQPAGGEGSLGYNFRIQTPGSYQLLWRSRMPDPGNRPETPDPDGNDSWIRFVGGADAPQQAALGDTWHKVAILGHPVGWTWNTNADRGPPHPLTPVVRVLPAGDHTVVVSGRSHGHAIDRLVLVRRDGPIPTEISVEEAARLTSAPASPRR